MSISTREQLKNHIHNIHDYIRNHGGGYGMSALRIFILFYGLKLIEPVKDRLKLSDKCSFTKLVQLANQNQGDSILRTLVEPTGILDELYTHEQAKRVVFHEIPRDMKSDFYVYIIQQVAKIPTTGSNTDHSVINQNYQVDLAGKVYEYFIGRDNTAISELGAYFTDRHLTSFILEKLDPKPDSSGMIPTMIDPFGGSGGFTVNYIKYLKDHHPNIDWSTNLNRVHHYDMNEDVVKYAGLECFALTGHFPDIGRNFLRVNSFTRSFTTKGDLILTNPPYGGDKTKKSAEQEKRDKLKTELEKYQGQGDWVKYQLEEIKSASRQEEAEQKSKCVQTNTCSNEIKEFCHQYGIKANDKEACSLVLMTCLLNKGGTVCAVLKEGVFFDKKYSRLREVICENYQVKEVISVDQDQFENTSTKTSILIFSDTGPTQDIVFSALEVKREQSDVYEVIGEGIYQRLFLTKCKGDIYSVQSKVLNRANVSQIKSKNWSWNGKDYPTIAMQIERLRCNAEYEMKKIGDICQFLPKSKRKASEGHSEGMYSFFTSSDNVKRIDSADYNEPNGLVIIGDGGEGSIHYSTEFSCSDHNFIVKSITYPIFYIYCILSSNFKLLLSSMTGSTIKNLSKEKLLEHQIPIPKDPFKTAEWVKRIDEPYQINLSSKKELEKLENEVKTEIQRICDEEECDEYKLGDLCELHDGYDFYRKDMDENRIYISGYNLPLIKMSDKIDDYVIINSKYDKYKSVKGDILLETKGNCGRIKINCFDEAYYKHGVIKFTNIKIDKSYLFYIITILFDEHTINQMTNKTIVGNMKKSNIVETIIKIPKNKLLIDQLETKFKQIEGLKNTIDSSNSQYQKLLIELSNEAFDKQSDNILDDQVIDDHSNNHLDGYSEVTNTESPINEKSTSTKKTKSTTPKQDTPKCQGLTSKKKPCSYNAINGTDFCRYHQ